MTSTAGSRAAGRAEARARMRDRALDATRETALSRGWAGVRMGAVATAIGTSRQSLHAEFGTKDDLGQALVMRETAMFFEAVAARLDGRTADPVDEAVASAAELALRMVSANSLLQAVLGGGADAEDVGLLPLLTSRSEPLLTRGVEIFGAWLGRRLPDLAPDVADLVVESTVRLLVSHAVAPTHDPERAAEDLALLVRCLVTPGREPPS